MTDGEALRRSVVAEPDDDTPRLVYADWLDENGQPDRAAFIRAQVEAFRAEPYSPKVRATAATAFALLQKHRLPWSEHLLTLYVDAFRWERGFIGHVGVWPEHFARYAAALFAAEPVQSLRLNVDVAGVGPQHLRDVFAVPELRRLRRLEIAPTLAIPPEDYELVSACPHLAGLHDFSLRGNPIHPPWITGVLRGGAFPELQGLDFGEIPHLGTALTTGFARADHRTLRRLDASGVVFTSDQLRGVLSSKCLRQVEELRLGWHGRHSDTGPLFHLDLGWVVPWDRLLVLDVVGQRLGSDGVRGIVGVREAAALRWLGLANNALDSEAVRLLVAAKHLNLNHLDVSGNGLKPAAIMAIKARFPNAHVVG